jgi:DNA-binding CsgD family transcriptional regulator
MFDPITLPLLQAARVKSAAEELQRLRHVEAVFGDVLSRERLVVYEVDLRTDSFDYISPYVETLTGFSPDCWRRAGYAAMRARCHPEDQQSIDAALDGLRRQASADQPGGMIEYRWRDKFDQWRTCRDRLRGLADDCGELIGLVGCVREAAAEVELSNLRRSCIDDPPSTLPLAAHPPVDEERFAVDTAGLGLTRIQRRVLTLILSGMGNKQIARRLHRSIRTVEDHRHRIMCKVGAENAVDLVRKVLRLDIRRAA